MSNFCDYLNYYSLLFFFFFNDTATTEIYTLSLTTLFRSVQILPPLPLPKMNPGLLDGLIAAELETTVETQPARSEEHTSELQSRRDLVCRLLLEKKN